MGWRREHKKTAFVVWLLYLGLPWAILLPAALVWKTIDNDINYVVLYLVGFVACAGIMVILYLLYLLQCGKDDYGYAIDDISMLSSENKQLKDKVKENEDALFRYREGSKTNAFCLRYPNIERIPIIDVRYWSSRFTKEEQNEYAYSYAIKLLEFAASCVSYELNGIDEFMSDIMDMKQNKVYPFMAGVFADYSTLELETKAKLLDWGNNLAREQKVESIRSIRSWAKEEIEKHKIASYQLQYLLALYPGLQDVLDVDYADLQVAKGKIPEHDYTRDYLSKEEWDSLTVSERNQLALDRYVDSHSKTKWQIGRDYEMYIGYTYETDGWSVQYTGVELGYEDLGRDLIVVRGDETQIVQCKYWSETKVIHEKHVMQLYGTMIAYRVQNPSLDPEKIKGVFVTNIVLSDTAAQFAQLLGIVVREKVPKGEFPRIKCNIGKDEFGSETHIYHLPMDLNYDSVKLDKPGECMVFTVKEAEEKGFRRAFKWSGSE